MNQEGGGGNDPFELDPFGEGEYDPSLAFAFVASKQADEKLQEAESFLKRQLQAHGDQTNAIAVSARKSSGVRLNELREIYAAVAESRQAALSSDRGTPEFRKAVNDTVDRFNEMKGVYDELMRAAAKVATADPAMALAIPSPIDPGSLLDPRPASLQVLSDLQTWIGAHRRNDQGDLVILKATPGIGKTYAMLKLAYQEQQQKQRITFAVRTKEMIVGVDSEMQQRIHSVSPFGRVSLAIITGRDESNCHRHEAVEAVMQHGYSPGSAVCFRCEHYPDNARVYGMSICPYYDERIRAHNTARGARRGWHREYPFVFTTHASVIPAFTSQGTRWGGFWSTDLLLFDEDPTDAMETDSILSESQCDFTSLSPHTQSAGVAAHMYREALSIAKSERATVEANNFRLPGSKEKNTHPVHSRYDSAYTGDALSELLQQALKKVALTTPVSPLVHILRDVSLGESFFVQPGQLTQVSSADEINDLDVPPKSLSILSDAVHSEINHALSLRRIVYERLTGKLPTGFDHNTIIDELKRHTDVHPMSYVTRLECLPADPDKKRLEDEWRFVTRDFRPLSNNTTSIVVGDAYAQKDHYEQLFGRDADVIDVISSLNPNTTITRIVDSACNISELRKGGLQRLLALVESTMIDVVRIGQRVLIYGHEELRPKIEQWFEGVAARLGVTEWAYEHWWGGRGKDQYNGWEHTFCLSDPVLSLSGLKHVANARAFRTSTVAKDPDDRLLHGRRTAIGDDRRGPVYALRASHQRIALEHDRMNVAELTQAMHRARPAHHPVAIWVFGEMEQAQDLIAQTNHIVLSDSRKVRASNSRSKSRSSSKTRRIEGAVDSFVTPEEAFRSVMAIIEHFGVYSPWWSHAMVTLPKFVLCGSPATLPQIVTSAIGSTLTKSGGGDADRATPDHSGTLLSEEFANSYKLFDGLQDSPPTVGSVVLKGVFLRRRTQLWGLEAPDQILVDREGLGPSPVPGVNPSIDAPNGVTTDPAAATEPVWPKTGSRGPLEPLGARGGQEWSKVRCAPYDGFQAPSEPYLPRTIIERVWNPPVYWQLLSAKRSLPKAIRDLHLRLSKTLPSKKTARWPKWAQGLMKGGRRPLIYYDPKVLPLASALAEYYRIVDHQYGPVRDGRLVRSSAVARVPSSISAIPF